MNVNETDTNPFGGSLSIAALAGDPFSVTLAGSIADPIDLKRVPSIEFMPGAIVHSVRWQGRLDAVYTYAPFPGGVPEPATWALLTLGFGAIGGAMRRRRVRSPMRASG